MSHNILISIIKALIFIIFGQMFLKVAAGFAIGLQVLIFAMLPYFNSSTFSSKRIVNAFNNFSAGLFLGIAFLHVLPQANLTISQWISNEQSSQSFAQPHPAFDQAYQQKLKLPYGSLISIVTFLFVLGIQVYMNDGLSIQSAGGSTDKRNNNHMHQVLTNEKLKMRRRLMLETYLTQLTLSIHSFFQCMSIGIEKKESVIITLAGAILLHKWVQALTLGFSYSISGMPKETAFRFSLFHTFLNFGAVLVGLLLSEKNDLIKGIANGISAGTFIYISIIEKISKNFENKEDLLAKLGLILSGLIFSLLILN